MKLTKTILLFSSVLLLASCNSGGGASTSTKTAAPTPTSTAPQPVEWDLPDYSFILSQKVTDNRVFTFDKTTRKLAIDYYDSFAKYVSGEKNTSKSLTASVSYELVSSNVHDDNTDMIVTASSTLSFRFWRQSGFFTGSAIVKEDGKSKAYSVSFESVEKLDNIKKAGSRTWVTKDSVKVYSDSGLSYKSYYLRAVFGGLTGVSVYKSTDRENWDSYPLYEGSLDAFNSNGVRNASNGLAVYSYAVIEGKERIMMTKSGTSSDPSNFDGASMYLEEE